MDANELPIVKRLRGRRIYTSPNIVREGMDAAALIVTLYEALGPFARYLDLEIDDAADEDVIECFEGVSITVGDIRRARAAIEEARKG